MDSIAFTHGEHLLAVERGEINQPLRFVIWSFTKIGKEILSLIPIDPDNEYLEQLGLFFVNKKGKAYIAKPTDEVFSGIMKCEIIREIIVNSN